MASFSPSTVRREDEGKTDNALRSVAVVPSLARVLTRYRASAEYAGPDDPIFASLTGTHQDAHNVRRRLRPTAKETGVEWATPHVFRHTLATELRDGGVHDTIIARVLGHADPNFTRRTYSTRRTRRASMTSMTASPSSLAGWPRPARRATSRATSGRNRAELPGCAASRKVLQTAWFSASAARPGNGPERNGKEGVDGSGPSEGLRDTPANRGFRVFRGGG